MSRFPSFRDARTVATGSTIDAEICIIGGGAAGIALARALAGTGRRIALLETGGLNYEADVHALGTIENVGRPYHTEGCRLRYLGGTTNHWAATACRCSRAISNIARGSRTAAGRST